MRSSPKPVRKCHSCEMNLGDTCWRYAVPRDQWRGGHRCPARDDESILREFRLARKLPTVLTSRELRRDFFRSRSAETVVVSRHRRRRRKSRGAR